MCCGGYPGAASLPADPASIKKSAAAEDQEHYQNDEERVGVHVSILAEGARYVCSVLNTTQIFVRLTPGASSGRLDAACPRE